MLTTKKKYLLEVLEAFLATEVDKIENKFLHRTTDGKTLYHYTELHGLKAIIEYQSLFASNSAYLNDKEEFHHGVKKFKSTAEHFQRERRFKTIKGTLDLLIDRLNNTLSSNRYVTCFSTEGDVLSQWRAYANDGMGLSIGFDKKKLMEATTGRANAFAVIYDEKRQNNCAKKILDAALSFYLKNKRHIGKDFDEIVSNKIYDIIVQLTGKFKHSAFLEENEFRFELEIDKDIPNANEISYRVSRTNLLTPHLLLETNFSYNKKRNQEQFSLSKHKVKLLPIKEIIIGPSLNYELNKASIERWLCKAGYEMGVIKISTSKVPYRI